MNKKEIQEIKRKILEGFEEKLRISKLVGAFYTLGMINSAWGIMLSSMVRKEIENENR